MRTNTFLFGAIVCCTVLVITPTPTEGSKILIFLPVASKSHHNVFDPLIRGLAARDHEVTVLSPVKSSGLPPNVETISPLTTEEIFGDMPNVFEMRKAGKLTALMSSSTDYITEACHKTFKDKDFQRILNSRYDVVIFDVLINFCMSGALHHLKAPYIYLTTMPATNLVLDAIGAHQPPSFVPCSFFEYSDRMDFKERFLNTVLQWGFEIIGYFMFLAKFQRVYREYLGDDTPSQHAIDKNVSMIFMNSHFSMTYSRPLLPDVIEVGSMHCRPSQPLPKDLEDFANGAEHGLIYFSLGTIAKTTDVPEETRKIFVNVFSRLKQRVLWKWEDEHMDDLPSNVMLRKFLPQQDILGHKNIKIFITHGGLLSLQETVYHGVPLIGIPLFADQDLNVKRAESQGFSVTLEIIGLTEEILEVTINKVLQDSSYSKRVKELSAITRDQIQTPVERAVYWTEYIIRHNGAPHLRSAARDLSRIQFHSIDVIAFFLAIIVGVLWGIKYIIIKICRKCFGSKKSLEKLPAVKKTN